MRIAASFLKIQNDKSAIDKLNECADLIHYDIMDGNFTANKTLSYDEISYNTSGVSKIKDVHLMVTDIYSYIDMYSNFNPNNITFHFEIGDTLNIINYIRGKKIGVGIAINPETEVRALIPYLDKIDVVLVMSVNPGAGGQKFIDVSDKVNFLYDYRNDNDLDYLIEIDGGINDETIKLVKNVDIAVVGSFITDSDDYKRQIAKIEEAL